MDTRADEVAGLLAAAMATLDSLSAENTHGDSLDVLHIKVVERAAKDFLHAYRKLATVILPALPTMVREVPVSHAGASGTSYHELTCQLARERYKRVLMRLTPRAYFKRARRRSLSAPWFTGREVQPAELVANWLAIAGDLAKLEPVDAQHLIAGLETDAPHSGKTTEPRESTNLPKVELAGDDSPRITYSGTVFSDVDFEAATLLQELVDAYPQRIGLTAEDRPQPNRIIEKLPESIRRIIDAKRGKGTCLDLSKQ